MTPLQPSADNPSRGVVDERPSVSADSLSRETPEIGLRRVLSLRHDALSPLDRGRIERAIAALQAAALPAAATVEGLRQGNWHHPDGGRIVGWVIEPDDVERLKADAFCLPREVGDALGALRKAAQPAVPEGWAPDVSNGGQVSVGDASHTPGRKLWHTDPHGRFWTGYTGTRTAQQLMAECESTIRDLRALLDATPAHDQPEGEG